MPRSQSALRLAAWLPACLILAGIAGWILWGSRVHRPPTPEAAKLPASARILLQPFRNDSLDFTVGPGKELNYQIGMQAGATLVYAWSTARQADHLWCEFADRPAADATSGTHNAFVAQSSGWYRWRWKNPNGRPVTIHFKLSGYYEPGTMPAEGMPYDR